MKEYCFGIDIGGTTVKCGLFSVKGDILDKWEIPTRTENNGVNILPDVAAAIDAKIQEKGIARDAIAGVGLGIPGPVNEDGAVICAVNLHWGYVELEKELEDVYKRQPSVQVGFRVMTEAMISAAFLLISL